jgi:hypothetical protein
MHAFAQRTEPDEHDEILSLPSVEPPIRAHIA